MITVYKYKFKIDDNPKVEMPRYAQILHVGMQGHDPTIWARVNTEEPTVQRKLRVAGTGHPLKGAEIAPHIGTFQSHGGQFVWHVFDLGEE